MNSKILPIFTGTLAGTLLGLQLFLLINLTFKHQNNAYVVKPVSADAASAIGVAQYTRLFNDNRWYDYGPVYYRLAHLISFIHPGTGEELHPIEQSQIRTHWSLMMVSLLSLYGVAWLFSCTLTKEFRYRLLFTFCMMSIFLNHEIVFSLVYVLNHPDLPLTLFSGAIALSLINYFKEPERKIYFFTAAFFTGAALATKMSFLLALPGMLFLFCPPFSRERLLAVAQFGAFGIASYFLVGIPQNFQVMKTITYLGKHSGFREPASLDSFLDWWVLYAHYSWEIFGLLFFSILILSSERREEIAKLSHLHYLRLGLFSLFPLIILSFYNWNLDTDYYPLPFLALFWICSGVIMFSLFGKHLQESIRFFSKERVQPIAGGLLLVWVAWHYGILPYKTEQLSSKVQAQLKESRDIYETADVLFSQGKSLIVDRFAPVPFHKGKVEFAMDTQTLQRTFGQGWGDAMIFTASWYNRFLKDRPNAYERASLGEETWNTMHVFYIHFIGKTEVTDPLGNHWKRIFIDATGNQIWEKQKNKSTENTTG